MNSSLLRIAFVASAAVLTSCETMTPNKNETAQQPPPGANRYLQDDTNPQPQAANTPKTDETQPPTGDTPPSPPPPNTETTPVASGSTPPTPPPTNQYPYGKPVPGKKGFVTSPYDDKAGMIDVRDYAPGTKVRDPYTNKIFLVP